ncbi:hypothetical protein [Vibrio campbellii]|uniref:hypothetical protein n=4 Tax=Vibrio harveyi group TaxID=717610 RepID=UPI0009832FCA|nr:hypothetical protein [Vibrio campbellii]
MNNKINDIIHLLDSVDQKIARVGYRYQEMENFAKIDNVEELQFVYWNEMLQRYHFCCATTLLRLKKWFEALKLSYDAENYYGFCTALRGIIESCADSFYLFGKITYAFADNFSHIKQAVTGQSKIALLSEEAENELIHYMYARKLTKEEKNSAPSCHNVKLVSDYLNVMKSEKLNELYSELCQVSHPSMLSLIPFVYSTEEHAIILHGDTVDSSLNKGLINRFDETIYQATILAIIPALTGLRIINSLNANVLKPLETDESAFGVLDGSAYWDGIEEKLKG